MKQLLQILILLFALEQIATAGFFSSFTELKPSITHTPLDNEKDVDSDVVIKLTYGERINQSILSTNNVVLTKLSDGKIIEGTVLYTEEDKTISFTPSSPLEGGQYEVIYKDIDFLLHPTNF